MGGQTRVNFSAGPGTLPLGVLERARDELLGLPRVGASILEISHRSPAFEAVISEAGANLPELLRIGDGHHVLFLQGGASLQFSMIPMNLLLGAGAPAAYVVTGSWGHKALAEARKEGDVTVAWDGATTSFTTVPDLEVLDIDGSGVRARDVERDHRRSGVPGRLRAHRSDDPRVRCVLGLPVTADRGRPLRPAVRRRPEERRAREPDDRGRA
jgi:hypothetical protein